MRISVFCCRLICCLLVCLLLVPAALADAIDLSALSNDEIVTLLDKVNAEVASRGINKTAKLPQGSYIGGQDLPVGKYIFTCMATGDDWGNITVYTEGGKGRQMLWEIMSAPKEGEEPATCFVTLNEGDQLKSGIPFALTIMSGAIFQ